MMIAITITKPALRPDAIRIAITPTYSAPIRKMVTPIRALRPWSDGIRDVVLICSSSSRDEPLFREKLFDLGQRGVCGGQHQLGRHDLVVRERGPDLTNLGEQLANG